MNHPTVDQRTRLIALALTRSVGWKLIQRLLDRFGSLDRILSATAEDLRSVKGIGADISRRIQAIDLEQVAADLARFEQVQIHVAAWFDSAYPPRLAALIPPEDRPLTLFWKGALLPADQAIAIVGTRQPAPDSLTLAFDLANALAGRGWATVSGLARGIDSAAHRGALDGAGQTFAVLGGGLNHIYPRENIALASQIIANGALISELHPDNSPSPNGLVRRNRLITALSRAVVVVEAGEASGALYAARCARVQRRPVFALDNSPGNARLLAEFASVLPASVDGLIAQIETFEQAVAIDARRTDGPAGAPPVDGPTQLM